MGCMGTLLVLLSLGCMGDHWGNKLFPPEVLPALLWWVTYTLVDCTLVNYTLVNCSGRSPEPGDCLHRNASLHHTPETPQCSYNTIYHHITPNIWRINLLDCPQSLFYFVPHSQVASAPINYMAIVHSGVSLILSAPVYVWAKNG